MDQGIEVGKQMAAMVSAIMDASLYVYAFDGMPYPINAVGTGIGDWEKAFKGIRASGRTGCGTPLVMMKAQKQKVEQVVIVTDEGETESPAFLKALQEYGDWVGETPDVTVLRCGRRTSWGRITTKLERAGIPHEVYEFDGDYYSLPNLVHFLTKPSKLDLLMEIMAHELPQRKPAVIREPVA